MQEQRICIICNKPYVTTRKQTLCCGPECSSIRYKEKQIENYQRNKSRKENKSTKPLVESTLADDNAEARAAGMSYGKYRALVEYGMFVEKRN